MTRIGGNLSKSMRQLNGVYTQGSNRRHGRVGHLFQGRYKAILVDRDSYLLELARYVGLNPVRTNLVTEPGAWAWSSYRAMIGAEEPPGRLATGGLLAAFDSRRAEAVRLCIAFVAAGIGADSIWKHLSSQVFLGDAAFVARSLKDGTVFESVTIPRAQRRDRRRRRDRLRSTG
jgi:putative transposase